MKKKTCSWLDSNIQGGIQILDDKIFPCCGATVPLIEGENLDYSKISIEELIEKRKELAENINNGTACQGCGNIIEKEENDINIGKINYLSIGLFSTCNLRCKYCYFTHEELGKKLTPDRTHLLPFVKKLAEHNFLKDDVSMGVAGGEPTLFEDLPETLNYLEEKFPHPSVVLLSNSSITKKAKKIAEDLRHNKLNKTLYTSVDAGTADTYKKIRGRDLFNELSSNLINYAKKGTFDNIMLKYILMFDGSNTSDKDIFGFLFLYGRIMNYQKGKMSLTIDCDMLSQQKFDDKMIAAAGKLYYAATEIFKTSVGYCGGGISITSPNGKERIKLLEEYASKYKTMPKSFKENLWITRLKIKAKIINAKKSLSAFIRLLNFFNIINFQ